MKRNYILDKFPRIEFAFLPTPLQEAVNLSTFLDGPKIFLKRDDLTGLACGGNKVRKLEFLLADAIDKKADYIVTGGGPQSNWVCQTSAACNKLGLKARFVIKKSEPLVYHGNLFLKSLMNAEMKFVSLEEGEDLETFMKEECNLLKAEGHNPYYIPSGGSNALGVAAYVVVIDELKKQAEEKKIKIDKIFCAAGSGGTVAGLIVGNKILNLSCEVIGISAGGINEKKISGIISKYAKALEYEGTIADDFTIYQDYIGAGYSQITPGTREAIKLAAEKEGIFLDPIYSGRTMAGLIDFIRKGFVSKNETVVFIHTGGLPELFAHYKDL